MAWNNEGHKDSQADISSCKGILTETTSLLEDISYGLNLSWAMELDVTSNQAICLRHKCKGGF